MVQIKQGREGAQEFSEGALRIYVAGSLRNPKVVDVTVALRNAGHEVFSAWYAAGPEADDYWQRYEKAIGRRYREALHSPAAQNVWQFDVKNILRNDVFVLVGPAGKSGHTELGFAAGVGKHTFILMDEPSPEDRWDVMLLFAGKPIDHETIGQVVREPGIAHDIEELVRLIDDIPPSRNMAIRILRRL